jgi:hypothetical protein
MSTLPANDGDVLGMDPALVLALTKAVSAKITKTARGELTPGKHTVSGDVHIEGTLTVGEDYEQRVVNKAKPWNLVYVLLEQYNKLAAATDQAGIDISKLVQMAEAVDPSLVKAAKQQAETEAAAIKAATLTPCKGKVTTDLTVTPL